MEIQVVQGRLAEVPTSEAKGMDRRVLASSWALGANWPPTPSGWTTRRGAESGSLDGRDRRKNQGGGTFHAVVFENEDGHAFLAYR